mgnify:CR=1 FL=1
MDWNTAQSCADDLLAEGLYALLSAPKLSTYPQGAGNYLFSLAGAPMYVGEAMDCRKRLAQQMDERRSTFYKNYRGAGSDPIYDISSFTVQSISVALGRKEIEDFGIVNLPTQLNRFQLGKRTVRPPANGADQWMRLQEQAADLLSQGARLCESIAFESWAAATAPDSSGLYLICSPQGEIIYVGESSDIRDRFRTHGTRTYFSAVRRNLGVDLLGFQLQTIKGKKRYFSDDEDGQVTDYLNQCSVGFFPVSIGRYELEEHLIAKHRPVLNRKAKPA